MAIFEKAGKCSPERRAVSSNVRTVHVAAPSEACRVAEHVGVEHKRWELVVLSVAIQSSLYSCCLQTQGNQRKALVTEDCGVEFSFTVSWHRLEVLRRSQFLGSSVVVALQPSILLLFLRRPDCLLRLFSLRFQVIQLVAQQFLTTDSRNVGNEMWQGSLIAGTTLVHRPVRRTLYSWFAIPVLIALTRAGCLAISAPQFLSPATHRMRAL